jgi:hypothetical protein
MQNTAIQPSPPPDTQEIGNLIRYWVHYDTSLANLNKQARQMRDAKNATEERILGLFKANHLNNPIVQIVGGRILVANEKHSESLNFKNLETHLHQYYRQKYGEGRDETKDILKFIKEQRQVITTPCLKKVMNTGGTNGNAS